MAVLETAALIRLSYTRMAAEPGFEPGRRRSERRVLPLHNPAMAGRG